MATIAILVALVAAPTPGSSPTPGLNAYRKALDAIPLERHDFGARGLFVADGSEATAPASQPTCTISPTEKCSLSNMEKDHATYVRPGGKTRCIFERTGPYQFEVIKGDSDKLLVFFQGGGACWDAISTAAGACTTGAFGQGTSGGVFERSARNPFKDYTVLHLLYCDGSMYAGNVTRPYLGAVQTGYENAKAALDWALGQMGSGELASPLSSLVVSGCSAGSIGAQLWADYALTNFKAASAAVVPDSYMGVFPSVAEPYLIEQYKFCTTPLLTPLPDLKEKCDNQQLSLHEITAAVTAKHPSAVFGQIQSKADSVQIGFDWALSADPLAHPSKLVCEGEGCFVDGASLYKEANEFLETYDQNPNHVHFLVQSSQHCYLPNSHFYSADPSGESAGGKGGEALTSWMGRLPLQAGANISTRCDGELKKREEWKGDRYCDAAMAGKVVRK